MSAKNQSPNEEVDSPQPENSQLYQANFENITGSVFLYQNQQDIKLSGEILVSGQEEENKLIITAIHNFALMSEPIASLNGPISLAGPVNEIKLKPALKGQADSMDMRLYYPLLSQLPPAFEESDATYTQLEMLEGRLSWAVSEALTTDLDLESEAFTIRLNLKLDRLMGVEGGRVVSRLSLEATVTLLYRYVPYYSTYPLENKALYLNFVNDSQTPIKDADLMNLAQKLLKGANEVWWRKGGVQIVSPSVATDDQGQPILTTGEDTEDKPKIFSSANRDLTCIPVYFRLGIPKGGQTHHAGSPDVNIGLDINAAKQNDYLLGHEIGHVFRLCHPDENPNDPKILKGSWCSIMVPSQPNSKRNTKKHLDWINSSTFPFGLGQVKTLNPATINNPDDEKEFHHIIRKYPYDDGTPISDPLADIESLSDVWNDETDATVKPGMPPPHKDPKRNIDNYLYVRIHACQAVGADVEVYLFLVAKDTNGRLFFEKPFHDNPLTFSFPILSDSPKTLHTKWRVPDKWPKDCWVLAISRSFEDHPAEIEQFRGDFTANPANFTFDRVKNLTKNSNNMALRKLSIKEFEI